MYKHTQRAPLHWLFQIPALVLVALLAFLPNDPIGKTVLLAIAGLLVFLGVCFRELTVSVDQSELLVAPLPLFGKRIALDSITQAAAGRSSWIDGWGIHYMPGRGWTYNLWGFDCIELTLNGKRLRIGTDEPSPLAAILSDKIATAS